MIFWAVLLLLCITAYLDIIQRIIPNSIIIALLFIGLIEHLQKGHILSALEAALFVFTFFFLLKSIYAKYLGWGDIKFFTAMAFYLAIPQIFYFILAVSLSYFLLGVAYLKIKNKTLKTPLPFAPFFILGFVLVKLL